VQHDLFQRLLALGTAHVSDACRELGVAYGLTDEHLRPVAAGMRVAGTAVTLRLRVVPGARSYHEQARRQFELGRSVPGAVMVIRNEVAGFDTVGAFDARMARASGYVGYLCHGPVRDTGALRELGFPVFATAVRPDCIRLSDLPSGTSIGFEFGEPVEMAGMMVAAGSVIVADGDGALAFSGDRLAELVDATQRLAAREAALIARLDAGASVDEILDAAVDFPPA
jgi:regulator of RNase E activity RraA